MQMPITSSSWVTRPPGAEVGQGKVEARSLRNPLPWLMVKRGIWLPKASHLNVWFHMFGPDTKLTKAKLWENVTHKSPSTVIAIDMVLVIHLLMLEDKPPGCGTLMCCPRLKEKEEEEEEPRREGGGEMAIVLGTRYAVRQ